MVEQTRAKLITQLRLSQKFLAALLELTAEVQDWQPEPDEWSFRLIAAHLFTIERECYIPRIKRIASGEHPYLSRYADTGVDLNCGELHESLARWQAEREDLLDYVASLSEEAMLHTGNHDVYGTITVADALNELVEQDRRQFRHVEQLLEDYLDEVNEGTNNV